MAIDVVVVNYHTDELLASFCESYRASKFPGCTLTVVDVESNVHRPGWSDRSFAMLDNIGYGKACNIGAQAGDQDVILLANADTFLNDGLVECYNALISNDDWGVLGPRQVNEFGQIKAGGIFGSTKSPQQRGWDHQDIGQFSDVRDDALSVSGSLYFIKRKIWQELTDCPIWQQYSPGIVGAFQESRLYFEEMTCSLHARGHGYKCVYYGPVQMVHYWHRSISMVHHTGGWGEHEFGPSQAAHREFCQLHGIESE